MGETKLRNKVKLDKEGYINAAGWELMDKIPSFKMFSGYKNEETDAYQLTQFSIYDVVSIHAEHKAVGKPVGVSEYWYGKIMDIRTIQGSRETKDIWISMKWYYSPKDAGAIAESLDPEACGEYELLESDHYDFVHPASIEKKVEIHMFHEANVDQEPIREKNLYCRYSFQRKAGLVRRLAYGGTRSYVHICFCHYPYDVNDQEVVHICPRPRCRKSFHRKCLDAQGRYSKHNRLTSSPDTDEPVDFNTLSPSEYNLDDINDILDLLPKDLILLAQNPLLRGREQGAETTLGIVGNVPRVVSARRLVYEAVKEGLGVLTENQGEVLPDDLNWRAELRVTNQDRERAHSKAYNCPSCAGPI